MSCVSFRPRYLNVEPASVERYTPPPHDELLRPLPSPVPTQTILPLPRSARSSLAAAFFPPAAFLAAGAPPAAACSFAFASSFDHPGQLAGASATAIEPIDSTGYLSNTGVKVTPRFSVLKMPPVP